MCEWSRGQRSQTPLSLLMIDADLFKAYNDTSGHQAGDVLLLAIAECIAGTTRRPADLVTRYGGEEFAVLLPETPIYGARDLASEIHRRVATLDFNHPTSQTGRPTVSIGVACLVPQTGAEYAQLVQAADAALYEAKKRGRNRTEIAGSGISDIDHSTPPGTQGRQVA
jgi:diguanylate cyclase (GGDEF)-like protein